MADTLRGGYDIFGTLSGDGAGLCDGGAPSPGSASSSRRKRPQPVSPGSCPVHRAAQDNVQDRRARNAAVLTRFWHEVEQYRRVAFREVST